MLFLYECKKIIKQRVVQLMIYACVLLCVGLFAYEVYHNGAYNNEGKYERGIHISHALAKDRHSLNKGMSDSLLQEVYTVYHDVFYPSGALKIQTEVSPIVIGQTWQRYETLGNLLMRCTSSMQAYDTSSLTSWKIEDLTVDLIWTTREAQLSSYVNMIGSDAQPLFDEAAQKRILQSSQTPTDEAQLQTYEDALGWTVLLDDLRIVNLAMGIVAAFIGALLFSKEHQDGVSSVLYTTKLGRTNDVWMKLGAGYMIISGCFILFHLLYACMILSVFTASGAFTLIQYQPTYWLSIFPMRNIEAYALLVFLGHCGQIIMFLSAVYISRFTRKSYHAMMSSLLILFIPMVITMPLQIFPANLCDGKLYLLTLSIKTIAGIPLFVFEQQVLMCILMLLTIPCFIYTIRKPYPTIL